MQSLPEQTYQAFRLHAEGERAAGRFERLPITAPQAGQVLIRVRYSSINYKDALASHGLNAIIRDFPRVGGIDLTGVVEQSADARWKSGDEVIVHGFGIGVQTDGGHAQYALVQADHVMALPHGLSLLDAATVGVAGYTAGLSQYCMELNGLHPAMGSVLVTGATGGVGSMAIHLLAASGYEVTAMSGKPSEAVYLEGLGARQIIGRIAADADPKPLLKGQWAGAIDSVGGDTLAWLTRTMLPEGVIASFGNAAGAQLNTTVLPFILRGIKLLGINANSPMATRERVWQRIAETANSEQLGALRHEIALADLPTWLDKTLNGQVRGRTVIRMD
ncbi:YhdH/YhfP family quinone oxidoreductase [Diaphorobacter sp. HDW4A]|uniref:YhdH/YhfP family quinone oxidoreductase n=1 Tax=Diaphorobacter sp. HDW4A TaxID=2714924 RepID=UPI00140B4B66|nr:YhdH/YhfP family quinone oxidoreductase [Diaphorobacter sp. HDW4A]QIL81137.1 YhdH/YhfP family quinone oxidoreductase [Diaphorobacter sp. HDW4A]